MRGNESIFGRNIAGRSGKNGWVNPKPIKYFSFKEQSPCVTVTWKPVFHSVSFQVLFTPIVVLA